jgi:hypothetical protein
MGKRHVWSSTIVFDVANALQVSRLVLRRQSQEKMLFFSIFKMKNLVLSKCGLAEVKNLLVAFRNILLINLLHIRPFCLSFLRLKFSLFLWSYCAHLLYTNWLIIGCKNNPPKVPARDCLIFKIILAILVVLQGHFFCNVAHGWFRIRIQRAALPWRCAFQPSHPSPERVSHSYKQLIRKLLSECPK